MADFVLNLNNFIIQQLMKGDNSQINIHIEKAGGSLGGELASWSTFALYGITIGIMFFTGLYYVFNNENLFRFREDNYIIKYIITVNLLCCGVLIIDFLRPQILNLENAFNRLPLMLMLYLLILFISVRKQKYFQQITIIGIVYTAISIMLFAFKYFNFVAIEYIYLIAFLILILGNSYFIKAFVKEELKYAGKYIFYLTDQKCYSAKLETIKEGFLVLHDVELYNRKVSKRSIYKPENKSFDVKRIQNMSSEKKILEKTMIIPKEQVLSMYIVEEKNIEKSNIVKKKPNNKIFSIKGLLIIIIILILIIIIILLWLYFIIKYKKVG